MRRDVLDGLSVLSVDGDAHDGLGIGLPLLVPLLVRRAAMVPRRADLVVHMLGILQRPQPALDEVEDGLEVLRRRRGDVDVAVAEGDGPGEAQAHRRRLAATARRRQAHRGAQRLLLHRLHERHHRLGLNKHKREA